LPEDRAPATFTRVRGHGDFCPLTRAAEVFATRWTPVIVRNLHLGCRTFSEIRDGAPGISRTVLTQRLRLLEHHGIIERDPRGGYALTAAGEELRPVCDALGRWGERWLELEAARCDPAGVLFVLVRKVAPDELPEDRVVVRFELPGERYWLLLQPTGAEVCRKPPGFDEDLVVRTTPEWLAKWFVGEVQLGAALRERLIEIDGPRHLQRLLVAWNGRGRYEPLDGSVVAAAPAPASAAAVV
jgi:DNA-binding HxlR family transcriptional regulator